jgi:hypothetical protein
MSTSKAFYEPLNIDDDDDWNCISVPLSYVFPLLDSSPFPICLAYLSFNLSGITHMPYSIN